MKFDRSSSGGGASSAASSGGGGGVNVRPTTAAGTSLDRLVRDIKQKVNKQSSSPLENLFPLHHHLFFEGGLISLYYSRIRAPSTDIVIIKKKIPPFVL